MGLLVSNIVILMMVVLMFVACFFLFDEVILRGYFATKLRKRFNVEDLK